MSKNNYRPDRSLFRRLLFHFLHLFHVYEPQKMKQMGEGRFFLIFRDKNKYEIETFAGGTNLRYIFTFIVFVLTPLTLKECLKSPISSICFLFTVKKIEKNTRFLPIVSTNR